MSTTKYWLNVASTGANPDWQEISLGVRNYLWNLGAPAYQEFHETDTGYPPDQEICKFCEKPIKKKSYGEYAHLNYRSASTYQDCKLKATPKPKIVQSSQTPVEKLYVGDRVTYMDSGGQGSITKIRNGLVSVQWDGNSAGPMAYGEAVIRKVIQ